MEPVDVSVVVCTRDRHDALRACLSSLTRCTPLPMEVVIVDQSRNGHTAEVVRELADTSSIQLRYLRLDSVGHTRARNAGVEASQGRIVAFTDDDCIVDSHWVGALSKALSGSDVSCACGNTRPAGNSGRPRQAFLSVLEHTCRGDVRRFCNPIAIGRGNNMAFTRAALEQMGGFNEQIGVGSKLYAGDDLEIFYRFLGAGARIVTTPDATVYHAQPDDWPTVVRKKRGYALSASAVLSAKAWHGDVYAGVLLAGKMLYEFGYLLCGGLLRMNRQLVSIGWHSLAGSLSGLKYLLNKEFRGEVHRLSELARGSGAASPEYQPSSTRIL